ncbi:MAG: acyl-CoA synthetase [Rhodoblastus sp.]
MTQLRKMAETQPDKTACLIYPSGEKLTFADLNERSNKVSQLLMWHGIAQGDGVAIMLDNDFTYFELVHGARQLGMYYTPISTHLKPDEAAYIVRDSGAKAFFVDARFAEVVRALKESDDSQCQVFVLHGEIAECAVYSMELARFNRYADLPERPIGKDFFYSSGTTGKPKGVRHPLKDLTRHAQASATWVSRNFKFDENSVYLSPAPLYHAAPLRFTLRTIDVGGTVVMIRKFEPELCLRAIEDNKATHSQWVPTMFFRLLALPDYVRNAYDLSSHRCAIHSAAPCPSEIKERMIEWWGPIIWEYYSTSERNGGTCISSSEWLEHRGSVGRMAFGQAHILDADGRELPAGDIGDIFFDGPEFAYHNDPAKTAGTRNTQGWTTVGDIGYLDQDGYLYLTDRRAHMIISGGVNIYPAEIENALSIHPAVQDVAVFGIPNIEFGEEVKAVVQLRDPALASANMAAELIAYCREKLSGVKCPRSVDFEIDMPRHDNGKLFKHVLKKRYLSAG